MSLFGTDGSSEFMALNFIYCFKYIMSKYFISMFIPLIQGPLTQISPINTFIWINSMSSMASVIKLELLRANGEINRRKLITTDDFKKGVSLLYCIFGVYVTNYSDICKWLSMILFLLKWDLDSCPT